MGCGTLQILPSYRNGVRNVAANQPLNLCQPDGNALVEYLFAFPPGVVTPKYA